MEPLRTVFAVSSLIFLILCPTSSQAAICSANSSVEFAENNKVDDVVTRITVQPGVRLEFSPPPTNPDNPFTLVETELRANRVLDYESTKSYVAQIECTATDTGEKLTIIVVVIILNLNDNPPVFEKPSFSIEVNEMFPLNKVVSRFEARDPDGHSLLYYTLTSESNYFRLQSPNVPDVLVNERLDYDRVKNVRLILTAQDTPLTPAGGRASFTATTTIMVNITDGDNRPPWFQPCTQHNIGGNKVCQSAGYTSMVVLNEMVTGVLPLKPGPLFAIDGDVGINEMITYSFLSGNEGGLFAIDHNTGNITMQKVTDVVGTVILTVLAAQTTNSHQFSTITVTISVQVKSLHLPIFQRPEYEGIITSVGGMAMDITNKDQPLRIIATDQDYSAVGAINPNIIYSINGRSDFTIFNGNLFMTNNLPDSTLSLEVIAKDTSNDESAKARLTVEVKSGATTTTLPPSSTSIKTTPPTGGSTTDDKTPSSVSTAHPGTTSGGTTSPSTKPTSATVSTAKPVSGDYGASDMAALGATLGILLFICLVVIGVLVHRTRKGKADSKKIFEASLFRSSLGQSGQKEGIQYTNEAFQDDEDRSSTGAGGPGKGSVLAGGEPHKSSWDTPSKDAILRSSAPLHALLPDNTSEAGSDKNDNEKGVKPILTKERRVEEGYKSVWFKEDIDPNAKEEVVIIQDSREEDREEDSEDDDDDEDDSLKMKPSKVMFAETDLDSGLGVKIEDPAEDSDSSSEGVNIDL